MRFTSPDLAKPTLTPLGHRLLSLSERKLWDLEAPVGAREPGDTLLKSVLLRQTVQSAWKSVDEGYVGEVNDWHAEAAMGLDVIGEEEEEEDVEEQLQGKKEEKWFEDLLSALGDEDIEDTREAEWVESCVSTADFDDLVYDDDDMETYTISSPPPSPSTSPVSPVPRPVDVVMPAPQPILVVLPVPQAEVELAQVEVEVGVCVQEVEVDDDDNMPAIDDAPLSSYYEEPLLRTAPAPFRKWMSLPELNLHPEGKLAVSTSRAWNTASPPDTPSISPLASCTASPEYSDYSLWGEGDLDLQLEECDDGFSLPPPLHRSFSSSSSSSGDDDCECRTPPERQCDELQDDLEVEGVEGCRPREWADGPGVGLDLAFDDSFYQTF